MARRTAIVSGASIAGLSVAYWLRRLGWRVTVIERAPQFRDGGQNVDVRGVAREVLDRMGLTEAVRALNTTETGTVLVDQHGDVTAELPSDGPDGSTAEFEVLRGDFARAILDALDDEVTIRYDDHITLISNPVSSRDGALGQVADGAVEDATRVDATDAVRADDDLVSVTTAGGESLRVELLVIAEGVRSSSRELVFGDDVDRHELGITMAFGTIPRTDTDDDRWRWYNATGGRQVHLRPDPHGTTRAILAFARSEGLAHADRGGALTALRDRFADAGWEAERVLDGFDSSDDVYIDDLAQIRMDTWHRGRVVLAGDAGWCVTPMGGGGASLALVSGYVLAAYLSDCADIDDALANYEQWMRPLVDQIQHLPPGVEALAYPQTRFGLALRSLATKIMTSAPLRPISGRLTHVADTDQPLPELHPGTAGNTPGN